MGLPGGIANRSWVALAAAISKAASRRRIDSASQNLVPVKWLLNFATHSPEDRKFATAVMQWCEAWMAFSANLELRN
jgi:hypothetical protein